MHTTPTWLAGYRGGLIDPAERFRIAEPRGFADETLRQTLRLAGGGSRVRVRLSNRFGHVPLVVGAARLAAPGADSPLTFDGAPVVTVPAGAEATSDPLDLAVAAGTDLTVSLYLPEDTGPATYAPKPQQTALIARGDRTADPELPGAERLPHRFFLDGVDVFGAPRPVTVALGDSWFEGVGTTPDAHRRSVDVLNGLLPHGWAVNLGLSGNRLLRPEVGECGLARFDHDVLAVPGATRVLLHYGINDLVLAGTDAEPGPTADDLIAGLTELADRAHAAGLTAHAATLGPFGGPDDPDPVVAAGAPVRRAVNEWLRGTEVFDSVADIAAAVADPDAPDRILPRFDAGDGMHLDDAGAAVMARVLAGAVLD